MMSRIKDYLLRQQNNQDQPNPKEIKLSFNDQWFLLTAFIRFIRNSKYSPKYKARLQKILDIFILSSIKGYSVKFKKIIAITKK